MGCTEELMADAKRYCYILIGAGTLPTCLAMTFTNVLRCQGYAKIAGNAMLIGTAINLIIDPSMIFGGNKGIEGSSVSIVVGNFTSFLICLPFLVSDKSYAAPIRIRWKYLIRPQKTMLSIMNVGTGGFFVQFANAVSMSICNHLITQFSVSILDTETTTATVGAAGVLIYFFFSCCIGINTALIPTASYARGAGLTKRFHALCKTAIIWQSCIMVTGGVILTAFCKWWPYVFYSSNSELDKVFRDRMIKIMEIMCPTRVIVSITIVGFAMFQSAGLFKVAAVVACFRQFIVIVPMSYILGYSLKTSTSVVISFPAADLISTTCLWILVFVYRKRLFFTKDTQHGPLCQVFGDDKPTEEIVLEAEEDLYGKEVSNHGDDSRIDSIVEPSEVLTETADL